MTLTLFIPPGRAWGTPHMSPFCGKLETYLRMTATPYEVKPASFRLAPKGKIPYVELDGALMGDSQLIIEKLEARSATPLDGDLTPEAAALGRVVRRMLEEATYFTGVYLRWHRDEGFVHIREELSRYFPAPLRLLLPVIRRKAKQSLVAQGTGRHAYEDVCAMAIADYAAIGTLLGSKPYLLGDRPHVCDASLYAFLEGVLRFPSQSPVAVALGKPANLVAYRDRLRAAWWADLPSS